MFSFNSDPSPIELTIVDQKPETEIHWVFRISCRAFQKRKDSRIEEAAVVTNALQEWITRTI